MTQKRFSGSSWTRQRIPLLHIFLGLLVIFSFSFLLLNDWQIRRALERAQVRTEKISLALNERYKEIRHLEVVVAKLSSSMQQNLTSLYHAPFDITRHQTPNAHQATGPAMQWDAHRKSKESAENDLRVSGSRPNVSCSAWPSSASPCMFDGIEYSCVRVPNATLRRKDSAAPREDCLGGAYSWGTCTQGKYLCRSDHLCHIETNRVPSYAMQECAVSEAHRFIFIHVPKVGGSSMHAFLRGALCANRPTKTEAVCNKTQLAITNCIDATSRFPSFFKFSFVRNPISRAVSAYIMATSPSFMSKDAPVPAFDEWIRDPDALNTTRLWGIILMLFTSLDTHSSPALPSAPPSSLLLLLLFLLLQPQQSTTPQSALPSLLDLQPRRHPAR